MEKEKKEKEIVIRNGVVVMRRKKLKVVVGKVEAYESGRIAKRLMMEKV